MMTNTIEIMNKGMQCLTEHLGVLEAEEFIAAVIREKFDYTEWQREYFDAMKPGEIYREALRYAHVHPYGGEAEKL